MSDLSIPDPVQFPQPQPLDIQHDTDPAHEVHARRIPHLGHAALFFGIAIFLVFACGTLALVISLMQHPHEVGGGMKSLTPHDIHAAAISQLVAYALLFVISVPLFRFLWDKSFSDGISLAVRGAAVRWWKLMLLGAAMSVAATVAEKFVHMPKEIDIEKMFDTTVSAWLTAISAAIIGPIVEEIGFRGFLLPALATAYDWLTLDRTPAGIQRWRETTSHTRVAWVAASIVSSFAFAGVHAAQIHKALGVLTILFCVSLVLSAVRIRFRSVAASALVHMSYNGTLMAVLIIQTGGFRHLDKLH